GPGILRTLNTAFAPGATFAVDLNGASVGTGFDQLRVNGSVDLGNATLAVALNYSPAAGDHYLLVENDGADPIVNTFLGLPQGAPVDVGGRVFHISYVGGDGNDVELTTNGPPVANPGGPYAVAEGGLTALDATGSTGAVQPGKALAFAWDLDGD